MRTLFTVTFTGALLACGGADRRSQAAMQEDGVPANSLSEKRLEGDGKGAPDDKKKGDDKADRKKPESTATPVATSQNDPTQPYVQPVANNDDPQSKSDSATPGAPGPAGAKKTGKVTKAECAQLFDRYIELAIGGDSRLEGVPPELIQQAKAQARQQKGDPCEKEVVPRAKYNCAIAATSTAQWQKCMK